MKALSQQQAANSKGTLFYTAASLENNRDGIGLVSQYWQEVQTWIQPTAQWLGLAAKEQPFFAQALEVKAYQQIEAWRRQFRQEARKLFHGLVTRYRQGLLVSPDQLREALIAQQTQFTPETMSPVYYTRCLQRLAQRLPVYANVFESAAAHWQAQLKADPETASAFFYHDLVGQLLTDSRHHYVSGQSEGLSSVQNVMDYYQPLVPAPLYQALQACLTTSDFARAASTSVAPSYNNLLQRMNAVFLPYVSTAAGNVTDVASVNSFSRVFSGISEALRTGWADYSQRQPINWGWGAALAAVTVAVGTQVLYHSTQADGHEEAQPHLVNGPLAWGLSTLVSGMASLPWLAAALPRAATQSHWHRLPTESLAIPLSLTGLAQLSQVTAQSMQWTRTLGGTGADIGDSVQTTPDGGYIVTGYTASIGAGNNDLWLSKWVSNGTLSWVRTLGGTNNDYGDFVQTTPDGGYIVTGRTYGFGAGNGDLWLSKWTGGGALSWVRTLGGANYDSGSSVQATPDGGYIVTGYTESFGAGGGTGNGDLWLSKWTGAGSLSWVRTLGGANGDSGSSVQNTPDGGYIVTGYTGSFGAGNHDLWLSKWTGDGTLSWVRTLGGATYADYGNSVQTTPDGGYIVAGHTFSFNPGSANLWLSKWTGSGTLSWVRTLGLGGGNQDSGSSVQTTPDGGYIVTGYTYSFGAGNGDLWLSKWASNGTLSWVRTLGAADSDFGSSIQTTPDGGYIVTGSTQSFGAGSSDLWLSKWDSQGDINNTCVAQPNITSTLISVSAATPSVSASTPSVLAQIPSVSAQTGSLVVGNGCNYPSVLTNSGSGFVYVENDPAKVIDATVNVSDSDSFVLTSAQIQIGEGFQSGKDILGFVQQNGINGSYDAVTGRLTLTGNANIAAYQTALRNVTYQSTAEYFNPLTRTFRFTVNDGQDDSNTIVQNATLVSVNDAPTVQTSQSILDYYPESNILPVKLDEQLLVNEDSSQLVNASVKLSPAFPEDTLVFNAGSGISGTYANGTLVLTGDASVQAYQNELRNIRYGVSAVHPNLVGERTVSWVVHDGEFASAPANSTVRVHLGAPPNPTTTPSDAASGRGSDAGLIAGTFFGVLGGLGLAGGGAYGFWRYRNRQNQATHELELRESRGQARQLQPTVRAARTIIGSKYELFEQIESDEAEALHAQAGIRIPLEGGKPTAALQPIGYGHYGEIRIAKAIQTQQFVAVKLVRGAAKIAESKQEDQIHAELSQKRLPHVMAFLDSMEIGKDEQATLYQFMPLGLGNGDKLGKLLILLPTPWQKAQLLADAARQLIEGLHHVHQAGVVHLDVKPANLIYFSDGQLCVTDFGCAQKTDTGLITEANGDTRYFAPERLAVLRQLQQGSSAAQFDGRKADAFAAGLTLLEWQVDKYPFETCSVQDRIQHWDEAHFAAMLAAYPELKQPSPQSLWEVIKGLLTVDPMRRLSLDAALEHPAIKKGGFFKQTQERAAIYRQLQARFDELVQPPKPTQPRISQFFKSAPTQRLLVETSSLAEAAEQRTYYYYNNANPVPSSMNRASNVYMTH